MRDEPVISIKDLGFTYAGAAHPALVGVDLQMRAGELVGVIGADGSGKTTLGRSLNGIVPHMFPGVRTGTVQVAGIDPLTAGVRAMARLVGIVLDDPEAQMSQLTVAEEVAFGLENLAVDPADIRARIEPALVGVGLEGLGERSPLSLSGGQQQRLAIASVVAMRPTVVFMDEPTSQLDPRGKTAVFEIARRLRADGVAVIVADQDMELIAEYADRVIALDAGRVVLDGPPSVVFGEVDRLARMGLRAPQVVEFALALGGRAGSVPVTTDATLRWMAERR